MRSWKMGFSAFNQKSSHGTTDDQEDIISSSASSEVSSCFSSSEEQDSMGEEVTSSPSSCSPTSPLSISEPASHHLANGPLNDMSSLLQQLPFKKGLSKHYEGKSQSFTSLANVRCLEDLAKPENPYNKKLKSCKSYGGGQSESHHNRSSHRIPRSNTSSRLISKKASRGSCSSLGAKRTSSLLGSRPPLPAPHRSTSPSNFSRQTPLFA